VEGAQRAPGAQKKSLSDALSYAAQKGVTGHDKLRAVQLAKLINLQCGGAIIAPWEIDDLDEEWRDVFYGLAELPALRTNYQAFDRRLAEIRKKHPTYRKYLN
jgi:hypothetical protein